MKGCVTPKKDGGVCPWPLWNGTDKCLSHAAQAGDASACAEMRRRSDLSHEKRRENTRAAKRLSCDLSSWKGLLEEVQLVTLDVVNSGVGTAQKATCISRLVETALKVMTFAKLEKENAELKELLIDFHPELKKKLRAVG